MCGIIGYTGKTPAQKILINALKRLEYRGYDSAGIAFFTDKTKEISIKKTKGKVIDLAKILLEDNKSLCGIGHTRWATHGGVNDINSHPHRYGEVTLIHNGIIENYHKLIQKYNLENTLLSQTDSEVAAAVINYYYNKNNKDPKLAIKEAVKEIEGSFAFCIMFNDRENEIYAIRSVSPMVAAFSIEYGSFIASDLTAFIEYSNRYFVVPENNLAILKKDGIYIEDMDGNEVKVTYKQVDWDIEKAEKSGYPHFMLKEIHEQPEAFYNTVYPRIKNDLPYFEDDKIDDSLFIGVKDITVIACGTAMYAGNVGKTFISNFLGIPVSVEIASEFRYSNPTISKDTLVIVISQSGETIDTLEALRLAKTKTDRTLSIVNVKGSSIARESKYVFYTHAGPEIAVASTKAYIVQTAMMYLISYKIGVLLGYNIEEIKDLVREFKHLDQKIKEVLTLEDTVKQCAKKIKSSNDAFFIGRGLDYMLSMEGALKLKEISYIHAEAYAAGELKHGTIALISEGVPVISLATQSNVYQKIISNMREVKARGAFVILITTDKEVKDNSILDTYIKVPEIRDAFSVFEVVVILQLLAYYTSVEKGINPDQPRNLAKSVTVE